MSRNRWVALLLTGGAVVTLGGYIMARHSSRFLGGDPAPPKIDYPTSLDLGEHEVGDQDHRAVHGRQ